MQLNITQQSLNATSHHFRGLRLVITGVIWLAFHAPTLSIELTLCLFALLSGGLSTPSEPLHSSVAPWGMEAWLSLNISAIVTLWILFVLANG